MTIDGRLKNLQVGIPGSFGNFRKMLRHSASSKPDKQPAARKQEVPALQQEEPLTRGPPNSEMLLRRTIRRFTKRNSEAFCPRRLLCCVCSMSNSAANRICPLSTPIGNRLSWHCRRARGARGQSLVETFCWPCRPGCIFLLRSILGAPNFAARMSKILVAKTAVGPLTSGRQGVSTATTEVDSMVTQSSILNRPTIKPQSGPSIFHSIQ